jgi:hypothetical protein
MAQPVWETPAGSLGTIPEGVFYSTPLVAVDPAAGTVYFQLIAGQLPPGLQIQQSGLLAGVPQAVVTVQGVPEEVSRDVESKFAVVLTPRSATRSIGWQTALSLLLLLDKMLQNGSLQPDR